MKGSERERKTSSELLNDTPLTSDKDKVGSPKKLNSTEDVDLTCSSEAVSEEPTLPLTELSGSPLPSQPSTCDKKGLDFVALAGEMGSDSEDEEYNPAVEEDEEEGEEKEERGEEVARAYTLRDGTKGKVIEEEAKEVSHDDQEKKKADDLWSAFKADVTVPIKRAVVEKCARVYDFAGEKVTVEEVVKDGPVRNKRKSFISTIGLDRKRRREVAPASCSSQDNEEGQAESAKTGEEEGQAQPAKRARPVSKLGSIVNRLSKRPKMTVLNKTALDWEKYKTDNKIKEDVKNEAKTEGYVERQDFLERVDHNQFEFEKEIRLQQQRRRNMNSKQF